MGFFGKIREIIGVSEKKEPAQQMRNVVEHVTVQPAHVQQTLPTIPQVQTQTVTPQKRGSNSRKSNRPIVYGEDPKRDGVIKDYGGGVSVLSECISSRTARSQKRVIQ